MQLIIIVLLIFSTFLFYFLSATSKYYTSLIVMSHVMLLTSGMLILTQDIELPIISKATTTKTIEEETEITTTTMEYQTINSQTNLFVWGIGFAFTTIPIALITTIILQVKGKE